MYDNKQMTGTIYIKPSAEGAATVLFSPKRYIADNSRD